MMRVLEFFVERSTFAFVTIGIVVALVGVPKRKTRYRALLAIGCALSIGAVAEWYVHLVIASMYFRDESHWYFFPLVALFVVAFAALAWELATLRVFTRLRKRDEEKA